MNKVLIFTLIFGAIIAASGQEFLTLEEIPKVFTLEEQLMNIEVTDPEAAQNSKLRITNYASQTIWINYQAKSQFWPQSQRVNPGQSIDYSITFPTGGARFWPKYGCDGNGQNCNMGESGGPGLPCPSKGCSPPIDSKFEINAYASGNTDWYDASQVDGWTLPYVFEYNCNGQITNVNCQGLNQNVCPQSTYINGVGTQSLLARNPQTGQYAGCYSPCGKLTYANWGNPFHYNPQSNPADQYCCAGRYNTNPTCNNGPGNVMHMDYTNVVHSHCNAYAWAYDDAVGLKTCSSNGSSYHLKFYSP